MLLLLLLIYIIQLEIFCSIINQRNIYFFCVKFYKKSEHVGKSNLYCTYSSTIHIFTYITPNKSTTKSILSLGFLVLFSKNS